MTQKRNARARQTGQVRPPAVRIDATALRGIRHRLLGWYADHQRQLPWRKRSDPYAIWVSEVMLQQTQVATAGPYYERWMRRFPTPAALAKAPEEEVLSAWAGLGYYSRARALHAGAKLVCSDSGHLPASAEELRQLPGVGPYTAGAIASIAFGLDEPAVDGNVVRVLTRLFALSGAPQKAPLKRQLWDLAATLIPKGRAGDFNQALMELGALCCTPQRPLCDHCPVAGHCKALAEGEPTSYPQTPPRPKTTAVSNVATAALRDGRVLVARLSQTAPRWAGMWVFPMAEPQPDESGESAALRALKQYSGLDAGLPQRCDSIVHSVTRFRITLDLYRCQAPSGRVRPGEPGNKVLWVNNHELSELPMPAAQRKLASRLDLDEA
jgi:A/G-specific adenine glycosylase